MLSARRASHSLASTSTSYSTKPHSVPVHIDRRALHHLKPITCAPRANQHRGLAAAAAEASSDLEPTCWKCTIQNVSASSAELLTDTLLSFGSQSVVIIEHRPEGAQEQEIFDDGKSTLWDKCDVVAHFALEHDVEETMAICSDIVEQPDLAYVKEPVANEAWVEQIKASYIPLKISGDLYIVPEWSEPEDPAAVNVILQPGVAFGTGEHPTTSLCLRHLHTNRQNLSGLTIMDYGTGSGVLAIAALLMGAKEAIGTDVDSLAVKAANRNAELNATEGKFKALLCEPDIDGPEPLAALGQPGRQFDMCIANILRGPLVELQPRLSSYVRPGGELVLSGILVEQVPEIQEAYSGEFEGFAVSSENGWAMISARKRC